jgi:predicted TIM-barrel fold metal-dependent hydrolase
MLPMISLDQSIAEMRFVANELGMRSGFIRPDPYGKRALHDPSLYPLWEAAQELGFAIAIHGAADSGMQIVGRGSLPRFRHQT